jgi:hypothetical protein
LVFGVNPLEYDIAGFFQASLPARYPEKIPAQDFLKSPFHHSPGSIGPHHHSKGP